MTHRNHAEDAYSGRGGLYAAGRWHRRGRLVVYAAESLALQVPSALFPTEAHNYVLNPAHPEFDAAVEVDNSEPLRLDPRIEARLAKDSS